MGFLDEMMKEFNDAGGLDALLRDNPQIASAARQFFGTDSNVGPGGGLQDVLAKLESSGLGDVVASWLGSGENARVSAGQLQDALGQDQVNQFANHAGIDLGQAAAVLAGLLPKLVDQMSPQGSVPEKEQGLDDLLGALLGGRA
jgi:uncharacterized protein YidB (DUF937 family)